MIRFAFDTGGALGGGVAAPGVESAVGALVALALWLGSSTLLLFAPEHVRAARSLVATERQRLEAEREALSTFRRRVESLLPQRQPMTDGAGGVLARVGGRYQQRSADRLDELRAAYRETVMSVDHYEEDYDEPLGENLATEFGDDVAAAVVDGDGVPPGLRSAIVSGVDQSRSARANLCRSLDDEDDRLADAADQLESLAARWQELDGEYLQFEEFDDLYDRWESLQTVESDLDEFVQTQQDRRQQRRDVGIDGTGFYEYLYSGLDSAYPVLVDALALREQFDDLDRRLTRALAGRG